MNRQTVRNIKPIFLMATERSGSNLIRAMMGSHPEINAPAPPNLLHHFWHLLGSYGDLGRDENFLRLTTDLAAMVSKMFSPWEIEVGGQEIADHAGERSLMSAVDAIYFLHTRASGKKWTFFKEIHMHRFAPMVRLHFNQPRFILLIRDGRDAVLSATKSPNHLFSAEEFAHRWTEEQLTYLSFFSSELFGDSILPVHYEDLVEEPELELHRISEFLEIDFDPAMLGYHHKSQFNREASRVKNWKNIGKPPLSNNYGKYKHSFNKSTVRKLEAIMYRPLLLAGYPLENSVEKLAGLKKRKTTAGKFVGVAKKFLRGSTLDLKELQKRRETVQFKINVEKRLDLNISPLTQAKVFKK